MARRRQNADGLTRLDQIAALYMDMTPEERVPVRALLFGLDRAIGRRVKQPKAQEQAAFEELGARIAEGDS